MVHGIELLQDKQETEENDLEQAVTFIRNSRHHVREPQEDHDDQDRLHDCIPCAQERVVSVEVPSPGIKDRYLSRLLLVLEFQLARGADVNAPGQRCVALGAEVVPHADGRGLLAGRLEGRQDGLELGALLHIQEYLLGPALVFHGKPAHECRWFDLLHVAVADLGDRVPGGEIPLRGKVQYPPVRHHQGAALDVADHPACGEPLHGRHGRAPAHGEQDLLARFEELLQERHVVLQHLELLLPDALPEPPLLVGKSGFLVDQQAVGLNS